VPEAAGPKVGEVPAGAPPIQMLVLGESTAAGVGAADHVEGLTGCTAQTLSTRTGRAVRWRVLGRNGATAEITRRELLGRADDVCADVAVLVLGVNDTLRLRSSAQWQRDLAGLISAVRERCGPIPVVLAAVPPMGMFPALPQPLRSVLALRAHVLDRATIALSVSLPRVRHVPMPGFAAADAATFFCRDGFHPSPAGYRGWGAALGDAAAAELQEGVSPPHAQ
jgi:lysophospholipase L1-like esterase